MAPPAGYTAIYCGEPECPASDDRPWFIEDLRKTVRQCRHGALVRSRCLLAGSCASHRGVGALVVIQPCDHHRNPQGQAVVAGPLHESADVADLCDWLSTGITNRVPIPAHLRASVLAVTDAGH